ncbi:hypothetical protein S40288_06316 [Stachybotrys chartarum IBT 40288]|nr:hypothetical protein S40288_06316 [Stachybotrys chartarum IBT 40288]
MKSPYAFISRVRSLPSKPNIHTQVFHHSPGFFSACLLTVPWTSAAAFLPLRRPKPTLTLLGLHQPPSSPGTTAHLKSFFLPTPTPAGLASSTALPVPRRSPAVMPKYYEYEEYSRRTAGQPRDHSPPRDAAARPYDPNYRPFDTASPRSPDDHPYARSPMRLEPPPSNARPRSVPPPNTSALVPRARSRSPSPVSSRSSDVVRRRDRSPSPLGKARSVVQDNFTNSTAGIGASLLGAVVGGFAAREASSAAMKYRRKDRRPSHGRYDDEDDGTARIVSTILGAVAGGLGANALANKVEDSRDKDRAHQHAWEQRHGREKDLPHYDTGRRADMDHRNGKGLPEDDDDYDYVYDDPRYEDHRPRRRRSDDDYNSRYH